MLLQDGAAYSARWRARAPPHPRPHTTRAGEPARRLIRAYTAPTMRLLTLLVAAASLSPVLLAAREVPSSSPRRYREDLDLLRRHLDVAELVSPDGAGRVAVVAAYQGRVMTSTAGGLDGWSLGWINEELVASGKTLPHMNPYGGEDRFWLGPEGGQFALFFAPNVPFDLEHWQTPPLIDTEPFETAEADATHVVFRREARLSNRAGTAFHVGIERTVRLLSRVEVGRLLGHELPESAKVVAFETQSAVTNRGDAAWTKPGGLPSVWILGMFPPSPGATVVIPFAPGSESERGPVVNDAYFGKVPGDRLVIGDGVLFFRGDGRYRGKIGIPPRRARPVCGGLDPRRDLLTLVQYSLDPSARDYVNSMWEIQEHPFAGDVVNSYNDGPPAPGAAPLGPFYEIETSSPALALGPGESHTHVHRTIHIQGADAVLDPVARDVLGVGVERIRAAFPD
jgi:hypothetical protein